jgi:hypothetical protein
VLRHLCEPLCVVEPAVEGADDILFGGDPVREERLKECVAVDGGASAPATTVRVARGSARPARRGGRGRGGCATGGGGAPDAASIRLKLTGLAGDTMRLSAMSAQRRCTSKRSSALRAFELFLACRLSSRPGHWLTPSSLTHSYCREHTRTIQGQTKTGGVSHDNGEDLSLGSNQQRNSGTPARSPTGKRKCCSASGRHRTVHPHRAAAAANTSRSSCAD